MMLTPIDRHSLPRALMAFAARLEDSDARRVFRRIGVPAHAARARGRHAALHHKSALTLAAALRMGLRPGSPKAGYGWDGRALRMRTEAYVLLHEIAHYQLAAPQRRRRVEFGLGPGPETGARAGAERQAMVRGAAREREEAMASLLGILWEVELGQPALASFLDQNWLEGVNAARHFADTLARLEESGFVSRAGRPTRRLRRASDG
jgi:hypothetical protein